MQTWGLGFRGSRDQGRQVYRFRIWGPGLKVDNSEGSVEVVEAEGCDPGNYDNTTASLARKKTRDLSNLKLNPKP